MNIIMLAILLVAFIGLFISINKNSKATGIISAIIVGAACVFLYNEAESLASAIKFIVPPIILSLFGLGIYFREQKIKKVDLFGILSACGYVIVLVSYFVWIII